MSRQVYVGAGLEHWQIVRKIHAELRHANWQISYDWTAPVGNGHVPWDYGPDNLRRCAVEEILAVKRSNVVVICLLGGRNRGTHNELGAALALDRPVVLWTPQSPFCQDCYVAAERWGEGFRHAGEDFTEVTGGEPSFRVNVKAGPCGRQSVGSSSLVSIDFDCAFYYHPLVTVVRTEGEILRAVERVWR